MIEKICTNIFMIFGTITGVCLMTLISYTIITSLIQEWNIHFKWIDNGVFSKRRNRNE